MIDDHSFNGQTIFITGGTGVLGREMVRALRARGGNVAVLARDPAKAGDLFANAGSEDGALLIVAGDVLNADSLLAAVSQVEEAFGAIDTLINAAGGNHPQATTGPSKPFFDIPVDALDFVQRLNLQGTILPCQVIGKRMAARGSGVILNISSMAAFSPLTKVVGYSAAKAAVNNFTQWLAVHMAQEYSPNIRVNAIAPGFFLTEQNRFLLTDADSGELTPRGKSIMAQTPMGRFGQPDDLIGGMLWLLSPGSKFVTGIVVPIDGGFSAFGGV